MINIENENCKKIKKNISIASCITSKARIKLYKAQQDVLEEKGRLLYSDTDSIFAAFKENMKNKKQKTIDWNKEKVEIKDAVFIAPKTYGYITDQYEIIKIKGFNNKSIKYETLKKKFYEENNSITIKEEFKLYKKDMVLKKEKETKKLNLFSYDKRIFTENKKETKPLIRKDDFNYYISHTKE